MSRGSITWASLSIKCRLFDIVVSLCTVRCDDGPPSTWLNISTVASAHSVRAGRFFETLQRPYQMAWSDHRSPFWRTMSLFLRAYLRKESARSGRREGCHGKNLVRPNPHLWGLVVGLTPIAYPLVGV